MPWSRASPRSSVRSSLGSADSAHSSSRAHGRHRNPGLCLCFSVPRARHKSAGFVIDAGGGVKPVITPDEPGRQRLALADT